MQASWRSFWRRGGIVLLFNSAIALALTVLGRHGWLDNLVYSMAIGLSIWVLIEGSMAVWIRDFPAHWKRLFVLVPAAVVLGYGLGAVVGDGLLGNPMAGFWTDNPRQSFGFLLLSLIAGAAATWFFTNQERLAAARLAEQAAMRQASEAQLRLLQSQLEPHMLFNTLANLRALVATDTPQALHMLDRLNAYLRATLIASRTSLHPLSTEFGRLKDYLDIMALRMGERLQYRLELPNALQAHPIPPLLLQPLVENAIRHGLEPYPGVGQLSVEARAEGKDLVLTVCDNGMGLQQPLEGSKGFGLWQIQERLRSQYGEQARFDWSSPTEGGLTITLRLPLVTA